MTNTQSHPLLSVRGLSVDVPVGAGSFSRRRIVSDVSLDVFAGQTLGIVGESGSGKTTLGRAVARLIAPSAGRIFFQGSDWLALRGERFRSARCAMQMVFQDPAASLNPVWRVLDTVAEPLRAHARGTKRECDDIARATLRDCGVADALHDRLPLALSGGQKQRVSIARALVLAPALLLCDEPTSALDASVQAQVLNLLREIQSARGLAMIFISHDLAVIDSMCDSLAVMSEGSIVEIGLREQVLNTPLHTLTKALLASAKYA